MVDGVIFGIGFAVVVAGEVLKTGTIAIVGEVVLMAVVEGTVGDTSEPLVCIRMPSSDCVLGIVSD